MRNLLTGLAALILTITVTLLPAAEGVAESFHLKDGSMLYLQTDGSMKMVDKAGKPMHMEEDVPMELEDGTVIMMRHKHIWKHLGPAGKGFDIITHE